MLYLSKSVEDNQLRLRHSGGTHFVLIISDLLQSQDYYKGNTFSPELTVFINQLPPEPSQVAALFHCASHQCGRTKDLNTITEMFLSLCSD